MAWVIQSQNEGPLHLADIGIMLLKGQMRDLDLIGRENAERSNDIKLALQKLWIKTIRKDPYTNGGGSMSPQVVQGLQEATVKAAEAAKAAISVAEDLRTRNVQLEGQLNEQKKQSDKILSELRAFADAHPLHLKTILEAIKNAQVERVHIAEERKVAPADDMTEGEMKARDKILELKDKKLEKNIENLGKTISASSEDVTDVLDQLDELGI